MRTSACVILLAFCLIGSSLAQTWKYCQGSDNSKIDVSQLVTTPFPIVKGKPVKFDMIGTSKVAINQKNARMDVYTSGTQIFSTTVGTSYSVAAGQPYDYSFSYTIPSFVPPGSYDILLTMLDTSGNPYVCVDIAQNF